MTTGNTEKKITHPAPLVLDKLRDHFRRTYLLNETQVETMLISSSKSLKDSVASAHTIMKEGEREKSFALVFHGLKGLLLNMGEPEWAAYTKELEDKLTKGERIDYPAVVGVIEQGLAEILSYKEGMTPEAGLLGKA